MGEEDFLMTKSYSLDSLNTHFWPLSA